MSRKFVTATPTYIEGTSIPITTTPFTFGNWFKANNVTARHQLMSFGRSTQTSNYFELRLRGDSAGDPLQFRANDAGGGSNAATTNAYTANKWWCAIGVARSATDREVWLLDPFDINDGIGKSGTQTTSQGPSGLLEVAIGRRAAVAGNELDGFAAESFVYDADIGTAAIRLLGLGYSPLDPALAQWRGNLKWYKSLQFDIEYPNIGATWTNTNTANDPDHPPMILNIPSLSPPKTTAAPAGRTRRVFSFGD